MEFMSSSMPWGVLAAEDFCADLVELAVAAFLWAFSSKHRTHVVELYGLRELLHGVFDVGAADGGCGFGAKADRSGEWRVASGE
jgi:hypothetical protein